jgi:RNA polymerase sigma factor (sigma-70 family)
LFIKNIPLIPYVEEVRQDRNGSFSLTLILLLSHGVFHKGIWIHFGKAADMETDSAEWMVSGFNERKGNAFEAIHHRFFRCLFVISVRITRNMQESEDIVNAVFVKLYTDLSDKQFSSIQELYNYLIVSVKNRSLNFLRVARLDAEGFPKDDASNNPTYEALELNFRQRLFDLKLHRVMDGLNFKCIAIVKMIYLDELSVSEIATKMGIAVSTVHNAKQKGLKILATILKKQDFKTI